MSGIPSPEHKGNRVRGGDMTETSEIEHILKEHLQNPRTGFSIGSLGAIAEFHRAPDEPLIVDEPERLTIANSRGGLRFGLAGPVRPLAFETLSRRADCWHHGVVFCLPSRSAAAHRRTTVTELGRDPNAVQATDRDAILFDLGLGARNVDFCVRTRDPCLVATLRRHVGRSVLEPASRIMAALIDATPHRVAISRLGRIEVYQPIGRSRTPEGPHTHVLANLLKSGRTHSAGIPVPLGHLPCLSLYPESPVFDAKGRPKPFDTSKLHDFETLLELWGQPDYCREKRRLRAALGLGRAPEGYDCPSTRIGRTAVRIALRQLGRSRPEDPVLRAWSTRFDGGGRGLANA